jgi:hypothetical protein
MCIFKSLVIWGSNFKEAQSVIRGLAFGVEGDDFRFHDIMELLRRARLPRKDCAMDLGSQVYLS